MSYTFQVNRELNTVDVTDTKKTLLFRWPLTGNYERRFTTHLLTKIIGRSQTYHVLSSGEAVTIAFQHDMASTVAVYAPLEYHEIKTTPTLWSKIKSFFTKKGQYHART